MRERLRDIHSRLKEFFDGPPGADATPLELLHAALDQLERKVQPAGRGRQIFPYDRISLTIAQPGADRAALEAVFRPLEERLRDRLGELRCEAPDTLDVRVTIAGDDVDETQPVLTLECTASPGTPTPVPQAAGCPRLTLAVVKGQCAETEYVFEEPVVAIGRTPDPSDAFGQVRHNHVAFLEERDGITETVGRAHARLQYEPSSGQYLLFNEGSSNPTSVIRDGRAIRVAPRDPRGVRVQSGDQIQLGRAVLRVVVG